MREKLLKPNRKAALRAFGTLVAVTVVAAVGFELTADARRSPFKPLTIFARALAHIEVSYVEPVDQEQLVYGAIRGMVGALDPHTQFLDPAEYRILQSDTEGRFAGIGVEVAIRDGWLTVLSVFDDGPAAKAGLLPGDRFLTIEAEDARDIRLIDAVRKMRGKPGTQVRVSIRRDGLNEALERTLTRAFIDVVPVASKLVGRVLYLQLKAFQEGAVDKLRDAIDVAALQTRDQGGLEGLLIDLRDNGGGLLQQAVLVSDEFLSKGLIVSTRGRDGEQLREFRAQKRGTRPGWPIVVLVNERTASAAEIVAGALVDHKRASLVGVRTFGKGSVQEVIELPDESALKLTVALYYTPSGRSIQAQGIEPSLIVEQHKGDGPVVREESLDRHLVAASEKGKREAKRKSEGEVRAVAGETAAKFPDDHQAQVGYQELRRLIGSARP